MCSGIRFILFFFFQAEDGIRDRSPSRGLGDVYKRQGDSLTPVYSCESEASGRDREDQPDYKVKMSAAFCFSNKVQMLEYYHNSSWLEHGGSPEHAVRTAFVYQINKYLKEKNLYKKGESAISFQDVQDCLVYDLSLIHI